MGSLKEDLKTLHLQDKKLLHKAQTVAAKFPDEILKSKLNHCTIRMSKFLTLTFEQRFMLKKFTEPFATPKNLNKFGAEVVSYDDYIGTYD